MNKAKKFKKVKFLCYYFVTSKTELQIMFAILEKFGGKNLNEKHGLAPF